jgi:quinol-cytochrome oxidoreductase complex cytochrome b subunit
MRQRPSDWFSERFGVHSFPVITELRKKSVPQHKHSFWYLFGGFALFLLVLQLVSGALMLMRYEASAQPAVDQLTARPYVFVRAVDSVILVTVTDTSAFPYHAGQVAAFSYSGSPESGVPEELQGKVRIDMALAKDSTWLMTYGNAIETSDDSDAVARVVEQPDLPSKLQEHVKIVRDASGGIIHPSAAWMSVERIEHDVPFGGVIRGVHAYGANLLIAVVLLHMFSAFFQKSYRRPRELMWMSGVLLLGIMLGFGFTGYLLPWNTLAYFATRVGAGYPESFVPGIGKWIAGMIRGGNEVTGETLSRMVALHVAVLPLIALVFAGVHMYLLQALGVSTPVVVKKYGSSMMAMISGAVAIGMLLLVRATSASFDATSPWVIIPLAVLPMSVSFVLGELLLPVRGANGERTPIPFYWNFATRDAIGWLLGLVLIIAVAIIFPWHVPAALNAPIDLSLPLATPPGIHPEWYFMFAYQLLRVVPGELAVMLFAACAAMWFFIPFFDNESWRGERSPKFTRIGIVIVVALVLLTVLGYQP